MFGIVDRKIGSSAGFAYSQALTSASTKGLTWKLDLLDRFLADPQTVMPGTSMPMAVPESLDRRNVIAYLKSLKDGEMTASDLSSKK